MPLFEVGPDGLVPFQPVDSRDEVYEQTLADLLWRDTQAICGEPLFAVRQHPVLLGGGSPALVGLDRTGSVVVALVRRQVGRNDLAECLEYVGWARGADLDELADMYWRGRGSFAEDWRAFVGSPPAPPPHRAARLLVVAGELFGRTASTLDLLVESGFPVTLVLATLHQTDEGRQLVEVLPIRTDRHAPKALGSAPPAGAASAPVLSAGGGIPAPALPAASRAAVGSALVSGPVVPSSAGPVSGGVGQAGVGPGTRAVDPLLDPLTSFVRADDPLGVDHLVSPAGAPAVEPTANGHRREPAVRVESDAAGAAPRPPRVTEPEPEHVPFRPELFATEHPAAGEAAAGDGGPRGVGGGSGRFDPAAYLAKITAAAAPRQQDDLAQDESDAETGSQARAALAPHAPVESSVSDPGRSGAEPGPAPDVNQGRPAGRPSPRPRPTPAGRPSPTGRGAARPADGSGKPRPAPAHRSVRRGQDGSSDGSAEHQQPTGRGSNPDQSADLAEHTERRGPFPPTFGPFRPADRDYQPPPASERDVSAAAGEPHWRGAHEAPYEPASPAPGHRGAAAAEATVPNLPLAGMSPDQPEVPALRVPAGLVWDGRNSNWTARENGRSVP